MPRRDTRTRILEAAATILGRDGPDGFSASALAREVGVSKATLFHHFGTIEEIPVAAFEQMIAGAIDLDIPAEAGLPDLVAALAAGNVALVAERRNFIRAYFVFLARAMFDSRLAALVHASGETLLARMRSLVRPKVGSDDEAAALARLLAIFLDGQAIHLMSFSNDAEIAGAMDLLARMVSEKGVSP
jgi:AcrR family transcriptional regulator